MAVEDVVEAALRLAIRSETRHGGRPNRSEWESIETMRSVLHKGGVVTLQTDCVDDAGGHGAHGSCMDDARGGDCSGRVGVGSTHGRAGDRLLASIKKRKSFSV